MIKHEKFDEALKFIECLKLSSEESYVIIIIEINNQESHKKNEQ